MPNTVLVTGAFGFIGSHVVRELLQDRNRVLAIDQQPEGNAATDVLSAEQLAAVSRIAGPIPGVRTLTKLLREHAVEIVVHLASPLATVTEARPRRAVDQMIAPHLAILDACRLSGVRRLVWASSVGVFGSATDYPKLPIPNDAPHYPQTSYGAAKSFLEHLSGKFSLLYGLETLGLRFPLVYGPGRRRGGGQFTTKLIEGAALGQRCVVDAADQKNDWMYVGDAARSVLLATRVGHLSARALTVCGQVATSREVGEMLESWFPSVEIVMIDGASDLVADFDPVPALQQIGYEPATSLREGVLATANAARQGAGLPVVA